MSAATKAPRRASVWARCGYSACARLKRVILMVVVHYNAKSSANIKTIAKLQANHCTPNESTKDNGMLYQQKNHSSPADALGFPFQSCMHPKAINSDFLNGEIAEHGRVVRTKRPPAHPEARGGGRGALVAARI
ncbi:hypothetical protein EVAR_44397_1 [Eumeta japonica]|uniref:Uncharacterized protein n=1 Tax=Eumeta variegata TaxID=151549 RepID=A0A4C1XRY7_EUMVA|nr:hypothetical protein EVAR_44397_1 [Eumeta japonica]